MFEVLPEIRPLLADGGLMELGPGAPNLAARPLLQELQRELPKKAIDRDCALACLAGLWLSHNFLDESHAISQDLDTVDGSYWHAILHRREPDYGNAKYWFRRVRDHAVFADLRSYASELVDAGSMTPEDCRFLIRQGAWDAAAFIDLCESALRKGGLLAELARRIQQREWELLFVHCHHHAFNMSPSPGKPGAIC